MFNFFKKNPSSKITPEERFKLQQTFNEEFGRTWLSGNKKIGSGKTEIRIETNDSSIAGKIEEINWDTDFGVKLTDNEKIKGAQNALQEKYKEPIQKGELGGIGGGVIVPPGFVEIGIYLVGFFSNWVARHLLEDADDLLWNKLKEKILEIYKFITNSKKSGEIGIVVSSKIFEPKLPTILFILPAGLAEETAKHLLKDMEDITTKIITELPSNSEDVAIYQYKYNIEIKNWDLTTTKEKQNLY